MTDDNIRISHVFQIAMPDMAVAIVSHPGMTVVHPMVERGEAWELLRGAPADGDLECLPQVGHRTVVFQQGLRAHEGFRSIRAPHHG